MATATANFTEQICQHEFEMLGPVYHACSSENHPVIFVTEEDYRTGMTILGMCAILQKGIRIIAFELMSNHIHLVVCGSEEDILGFFRMFKRLLARHMAHDGRADSVKRLEMNLFRIESLENLRNVIAYVHRNGFIVNKDMTPHSYPWGTNRFYFNPDSRLRYSEVRKGMGAVERRAVSHSRLFDDEKGLFMTDDYVSPLCFCAINEGESMFRNARHYYSKVSRHIESYDDIARSIGEDILYTDEDLYSAMIAIIRDDYGTSNPSLLAADAKFKVAKTLRYNYNATRKQIQRMLKVGDNVLNALFMK